jgi:UDP-glucuronate decarboxylase
MNETHSWSYSDDHDAIVTTLDTDWSRLKGARIFMTGGTGFIGQWMLESLKLADVRHGLNVDVVVLTRDPAAFAVKAPQLAAYPGFRFVAGDVGAIPTPDGAFSHVIHAATDASAHLNEHDPKRMFDTIVDGTRRILDIAVDKKVDRFFFFSSGAVYGAQPWEMTHVAEDWLGGPDCLAPRNAYGEGKRAAEMMCAIYAKQFGLDFVIARIFAALGPLLSLDIHFAAGNFIRDAIAGRRISIVGAGTAVRSLLYAGELTEWLWAALLRGQQGSVYNIGSEEAVTIAELAERVSITLGRGNGGFEILGQPDPGWNPGRYVPSTARIRHDLGVSATIGLDEQIRRTALWNGWRP